MIVLPLWTPASVQATSQETASLQAVEALQDVLTPSTLKIEDVTRPLVKQGQKRKHNARIKACRASQGRFVGGRCVIDPPAPIVAYTQPTQAYGLTGSLGYTVPWGNCVNQIPFGQRGPGNPINWGVTTYQPYIGAAALFPYNHVGRVVGIWSNGDVEIVHENGGGLGHRFSASSLRGFR